jgi:hypothetical protein
MAADTSWADILVIVGRKWEFALCQNCVTNPPKHWGNTVAYGHTSTHIDVAEIVESEVRRWDLVCVSTRERIQSPSVRLHPPSLDHVRLQLFEAD